MRHPADLRRAPEGDEMSEKHISQEDRLLARLDRGINWIDREGWVSLPSIMELGIASHTKIISNLRAAGHNIECEKKFVDGVMHVRYRLVCPVPVEPPKGVQHVDDTWFGG